MPDILVYIIASILLFMSGAFSGLNIGMMMARPEDLRRKSRGGDKIAERVYRYRKDGYYLIFCILLGNVGVNTALSILLGDLTSGVVGGTIAIILITSFGEILPQAMFSQRGYRLVRHFFWLLDVVYVIFWPLAKPVSKLLEKWVGKEPPLLYSHQEIEQIVHEHAVSDESSIDHDESRIVSGALRFSKKTVSDVATPIDEVFSLSLDEELDAPILARMKKAGHSRVPVRDEAGDFVGLLYIKDLIGIDIPVKVSRVYRDKIHDIDERSNLDSALSRFIQTRSHLFVVLGEGRRVSGIVTLEDVIEEIIDREIEDEYDA